MEPPSRQRVSVLNRSGKRIRVTPIKRAVHLALSRHASLEATACVLLTTDDEVRELNRTFRGIDEPTDVLSFPSAGQFADSAGDIAIAVPYATRQAKARGESLQTELCYLAIHGALHLMGLDDETEPERKRMLHQMNAIGSEMGLTPDPDWSSLLHKEHS